ncbi:MAG: lytic murein transglycosylase [Magnetococcales bacterium]|nr:lytic murein transglycosylase [Magnetococcales bacterium]
MGTNNNSQVQDAPGQPGEQGLLRTPGMDRRGMLRLLTGCSVAALGPWSWSGSVWSATAEGWITRYPWLLSWIEKDGFDRVWLEGLLSHLEPDPKVLYLMDHQTEAKPYHEYRSLVLNWRRVNTGRTLLKRHRSILAEVEGYYRVPPEIVVALWGLESDFGNNMGGFNVLRTLYTLAAHYPRRAAFFQEELREFLLLCREEGWDPKKPKGSYAGAMGQVQMMPGSLRRHAVDFNHDGRRDVIRDVADTLGSIAAFLHDHGWCEEGRLVQQLPVRTGLAELVTTFSGKRQSWQSWRELGIVWPGETGEPGEEESLALIVLEEQDGPRYYMTFMNFWVITRWNRSNRFAMVVREFAQELRRMEKACGSVVSRV